MALLSLFRLHPMQFVAFWAYLVVLLASPLIEDNFSMWPVPQYTGTSFPPLRSSRHLLSKVEDFSAVFFRGHLLRGPPNVRKPPFVKVLGRSLRLLSRRCYWPSPHLSRFFVPGARAHSDALRKFDRIHVRLAPFHFAIPADTRFEYRTGLFVCWLALILFFPQGRNYLGKFGLLFGRHFVPSPLPGIRNALHTFRTGREFCPPLFVLVSLSSPSILSPGW